VGRTPTTSAHRRQTAKQVLMQLIRDIQRRQMYEEFANREVTSSRARSNRTTIATPCSTLDGWRRCCPGRQIAFERYDTRADQGLSLKCARPTRAPDRGESHPPGTGRETVRDRSCRESPTASSNQALAREPGHRRRSRRVNTGGRPRGRRGRCAGHGFATSPMKLRRSALTSCPQR